MRSWKELFLASVLETDKKTLEKLVHDVEGAIFLRLMSLGNDSEAVTERQEIELASAALHRLKRDKLGWP